MRSWLAKVDVERRRQELEEQRCLDQARDGKDLSLLQFLAQE